MEKISFQAIWNEIEDNFDFEKVNKVMFFISWRWVEFSNSVPTISRLKEEAKKICILAYTREGAEYSSGGFTAKYDGNNLHLKFTLEEASSE